MDVFFIMNPLRRDANSDIFCWPVKEKDYIDMEQTEAIQSLLHKPITEALSTYKRENVISALEWYLKTITNK